MKYATVVSPITIALAAGSIYWTAEDCLKSAYKFEFTQ